jgi:vacuolar iron transporter family protein
VDDFDYLPEGALAYGDVPYGSYPDATATWPGDRYAGGPPADYPPRQANGMPWRPPADEGAIRGYPPRAGRVGYGYPPPVSGPMPRYQPGTRPPRAYSGPMPAYRPDSGPMPAYRDRGPGYRTTGTALLAGPPRTSGPRPAGARQRARRPAGDGAALDSLLSIGKRVPAWLPFGNRLVLLPRDLTLDEADGELREHRDVNGGWLRPAVFGAMDGLVTNSSLIAGIGGGGAGHGAIVLTGIAGLIAGAFSMATGEYISVKSQNELAAAEVELERKQHARDPEGKRTRLTEVYMEKGVSPNLAEAVVRQISADLDRAVATHVREELGIDPDDLPSPRTAAVASFASFTVGALIPLSPFLAGYPMLSAALVLAGASAFAGGAAVANLTGRSPLLGGLRQFTAALLATGMAFLIGHLVSAHVG